MFEVGDGRRFSYDMIIRILLGLSMVDSILKKKIRVWKFTRSKELITIQCQLCLVEIKDKDKARWSVTRSGWFLLCSHLQ